MKRGELKRDPERLRAFQERGRASSAKSLGVSAREAAQNLQRAGRATGRRISPASKAQRKAVSGMACLGCGKVASDYRAIDPAHVWPRGRGGCDSRFCVIPLCRVADGSGCHHDFDRGQLEDDVLRIMAADFGRWRHHVQHALRHCNLVELVERLAGARTQWSDT